MDLRPIIRRAGPAWRDAAALAGALYETYTATQDYPMRTAQRPELKRTNAAVGQQLLTATKKRKKNSYVNSFQAPPRPFKEKKWIDVAATVTFNTTVTTSLLNGTVVGTDYFERLGHNYVNKKLHLQYMIFPAPLTTTEQFVQVLVVYDRQTNGVAPTWADVSQSTNNGGTLTSGWNTQTNIENSTRFLVLHRRLFNLPGYTNTAGVITNIAGFDQSLDLKEEIHRKYLQLPTRCSADLATVGSIISGSIYLMTLGSNATAGWKLIFNSRIRFEG